MLKLAARMLGAVFSVICFCSPGHAKFVVAWSAVSALNSPFWVMQDAGFFKKEGLDVELVYIASSPTVARATLAGDIVISGANSQVIVDVGLNGGDLVAMGAITNVVAFYVMAAPEIKTVTDLRGKVVGVTRFGASTDHKEETRAIFARYTKINDPGMLDGSIQYGYDFMEKIPLVKSQAFQVTLDQIARNNPKAKQAKPEQFFDNSLVQELVNDGFFTKLWGKNL